jgi:WD40 repeat protein
VVQIRDARLGFREVARLDGHGGSVRTVAFSSDGKLLASGSDGNDVHLWDVATWTETHKLSHERQQAQATDAVHAVAFSPDGKLLASASGSGGFEGSVQLWNVSTGARVLVLEHSNAGTSRVVFSRDGEVVLMGSRAGGLGVHRWSVGTGREEPPLGPKGAAEALALTPDGHLLATGNRGGKRVQLWDVATGTEVRALDAGGSLLSVAFSPDGGILAAGSRGGVRLWDVATWACRLGCAEAPSGGLEGVVFEVGFSPGGEALVADGREVVRVLDVAKGSGARAFVPLPGTSAAGDVSLSRDGTRMASVSGQNGARVWTLGRSPETREVERCARGVEVAISPGGETLAATCGGSARLFVAPFRDRDAGGPAPPSLECPGALAFSPDGKTLACGSSPISLFDVPTGGLSHKLAAATQSTIQSLAFSPDGALLASSSSGDHAVRLWDVATGAEVRHVEGFRQAFSPDGKTLASGGQALALWDVATGAPVRTFEGHKNTIGAVAFSPDGRTLASGSSDETARLWNVATGAETHAMKGRGSVRSVAFTQGGRLLVTSDGTIHLWTAEGEPVLDLVAFSERDGGYAVAPGSDPRVELLGPDLDAASGALVCRAGALIFPFELCRERFEAPGLVAAVLAGDASFAEP